MLNETSNIEYKEQFPEKDKDLKAEIVSFLNSTTGGRIYLGVNDHGENIIPISERYDLYQKWEEKLANWISTAFRPDVMGLLEVNPNSELGFEIIISSGVNQPYYFTEGQGVNYKGIWLRNGSTKRLASDEEVRRMMARTVANTYDREKIDKKDLTFDYTEGKFISLDKYFDPVGLEFQTKQGDCYNRAALLVSDQNPFISKVAVFKGNSTLEFRDKQEFTGAIVKQIDDVLDYIRIHNSKSIKITRNGRDELFSYPEVALREAIVNAFVHRDYTLTADIKIEVYDDRMIIFSPGSLPDGLTVEDIKNGANAKRNPVLVNALDKMHYIENYGSGIRRIFHLYKNFPKPPQLEATRNLFTVTLYNKNYMLNTLELPSKGIEIIEFLQENGLRSRKEIQESLSIQKSYTGELLATLRKLNLIATKGRGPATRYFVEDLSKISR